MNESEVLLDELIGTLRECFSHLQDYAEEDFLRTGRINWRKMRGAYEFYSVMSAACEKFREEVGERLEKKD